MLSSKYYEFRLRFLVVVFIVDVFSSHGAYVDVPGARPRITINGYLPKSPWDMEKSAGSSPAGRGTRHSG